MPKPMSNLVTMPDIGWKDNLYYTAGKGARPYAHLANCLIALKTAPEWRNVLVWNDFTHKIEIECTTPWGASSSHAWTDHDDSRASEWFQSHDINVNTKLAAEAVETAAHARCVNPLLDWLGDLMWDHTPRIHDWLTYFLGVEDNEYTRMVGRKWLISAVARAYQPGCKADCCLILEGPQGLKKSTALKTLAGPHLFTDYVSSDLGSKEAAILCSGVWIIEFSELEGIMSSPSKVGTVKAFLSRTDDRFRPHYGKHPINIPRQCIFAATTNDETYMHDRTGNRRFWPVKCGDNIKIAQLERERNQLWAEAQHAYLESESWWLEGRQEDMAKHQQSLRLEIDPWQDQVVNWLTSKQDTSIADVLETCLRIEVGKWARTDEMRAARCMAMAGWEKYRVPGKGTRRWRKMRELTLMGDSEDEDG